jgi:adenosine deaminase
VKSKYKQTEALVVMTHTLFCSLGSSPAVVMEAVCEINRRHSGAKIDVYIITSEGETTTRSLYVLREFFETQPTIRYMVARVAGFVDLQGPEDQLRFEENLFRLYLWVREKHRERVCGGDEGRLYVCLAGGFKTMSSAMQQAAGFFGADEVFHVIAEKTVRSDRDTQRLREPASMSEVMDAVQKGEIHYIPLGGENGWPQFQHLSSNQFPLQMDCASESDSRVVCISDAKFPEKLKQWIESHRKQAHNISSNWQRLSTLPFPRLATWNAAHLDWLEDPVDPVRDREWVVQIPKIDLHLHLGGFATDGDLLDQVRNAASTPLPPKLEIEAVHGWPLPTSPVSLLDYMRRGDNTGSRILHNRECLKRHCELLYLHLLEQKVVYAEIRCSPANYASCDRTSWDVLSDIRLFFAEQMQMHPNGPLINLIIIATRKPEGGNDYRADIARHLSLAVTASEHWGRQELPHVVGVDLAGYENKNTRAHLFREDFSAIHRCGIAITVHAGENDDAEGIWRAVFDLNTRRIGHALSLIRAPDLMKSIASRKITVEMCPYANFQIKGFYPMLDKPEYPLVQYLRAGIPVTINTDNPGISSASITDNILQAARMCPDLRRKDVLCCQYNALQGAFASTELKQKILDRLSNIPTPR